MALEDELQFGTHSNRLTSHRVALGGADEDKLSIFSSKIAGDSPSALSGAPGAGARVKSNGPFESLNGQLNFDM